MGIYTVNAAGIQAAQVVRQTFPQAAWLTMIAVADAESNFECGVVNGPYVGLFQIGTYHVTDPARLTNCLDNAQEARKLWDAGGYGQWQTYTNGAYKSFLPLAETLLSRTAAGHSVNPVTLATTYALHGSARVGPGGRIIGRVSLRAEGGAIPYRVTMAVSPSYGSTAPTQTVKTGTAPANRTIQIVQSLVAPLPAAETIHAYQLHQPGPVEFPYTVAWTVTDTHTGATRTINGGQRLLLTIA